MAEIEPFCGWRFNANAGRIEQLSSPLFDYSEHTLLQNTYKNPYNINHLFLPDTIEDIEKNINSWKKANILIQDPSPSIYVFAQTFHSHQTKTKQTNLGFIGNVQLHEWADRVILKHENVIETSVDQRIAIIEKTKMHFCPIHGLYTDEENSLESFMLGSLENPIYHFQDILGIENKLSAITDQKIIHKFRQALLNKRIILADGHHRYEAALTIYRNKKSPSWRYHPMYLTNTESNKFEIFPIYRLIRNLPDFDPQKVIEKLIKFFSVEIIEEPYIMENLVEQNFTFGIIFKNKNVVLKLKPESLSLLQNKESEIENLDLTVVNLLILEKSFEIEGIEKKKSRFIDFSFNFTKTVLQVQNNESQAAIIFKPITIQGVKKVCYNGLTLPYKSTYFFPKAVCGLVSNSLKEEDFVIEDKIYKRN